MSSREATSRPSPGFAGLLLLPVLLATSGCPITPKYVRPDVPLPPNWSASDDPRLAAKVAVDVAWWRSFNDPTLDRLIELAYRQNLPLQIAGLRILEARAQLGIAIGQQYPSNPSAIAGASLTGLNEHNATAGDVDLVAGRYQVGFDALWEVDFWGKFRRGVKAAKAAILATVADYDDALVALDRRGRAHLHRSSAPSRCSSHWRARTSRVQEDGLRIAESRFKQRRHLRSSMSRRRPRCSRARARPSPSCRSSLQQAENALCTLLGRATGCAPALLAGAERHPDGRRRRWPSACRPSCCDGVPTSAAPSSAPSRSAIASASPRRTSSPSFDALRLRSGRAPSAAAAHHRAPRRCSTSSTPGRSSTPSAPASSGRSSATRRS